MNITTNYGRMLGCVAVAATLVAGTALSAEASTPAPVQGWQALVGCWEPVAPLVPSAAAAPAKPDSAQAHLVCILPVDGSSSIEFVTIADGKASAREHVDASGARQPLTRDDCSGWQSAEWSADGHRLFLRSELTCTGGLKRTSSGVISMPTASEWVDVQAVSVGQQKSVRTLRYREARSYAGVPAAEMEAIGARPASVAVSTARIAAAAPVSAAELVDVGRRIDATVVEAWLAQQQIAFKADARRLVQLADAGMSEGVIDMVVALSYPERFTVAPAAPAMNDQFLRPVDRPYGMGMYGAYDPFWDPFHRMNRRYYSPYGYGGYGYGGYGRIDNGYYGGGYYMGTRPVVIVVTEDSARGGGKVINGRGYTPRAGTSSTPASTRRGRSTPGAATGSQGSGSSSAGSSSSGSSGGSSSSGSSSGGSSSGGSSSGERTAKRRPPPGT